MRVSSVPFGLHQALPGFDSTVSLGRALPIIASHFGISGDEQLLQRFQSRIEELLTIPEVVKNLDEKLVGSLDGVLKWSENDLLKPIELQSLHALEVLHSIISHFDQWPLPGSSFTTDSVREGFGSMIRRALPGPQVGMHILGAIDSRNIAQEPEISVSAVSGGIRTAPVEKQSDERLQALSPVSVDAPALPPKEKQEKIRSQIADWVVKQGGKPELAMQRIMIVNNGMAATCLIKEIRRLSEIIATELGLNSSQDRMLDIVGLASLSDIETKQNYLTEVDHLEEIPVEKAGDVFLNNELIFKTAKKLGVDTLMLGWGWVAENAQFVRQAREHGFNVVAPPPDAIEKLGGKISSKLLAEDAEVPVLPWTRGAVNSELEAIKFAREHDFRVAIKADAGGGGKGIVLVKGRSDPKVNYGIWRDAISTDNDGRKNEFVSLCLQLSQSASSLIGEKDFSELHVSEQGYWIQALRLAVILQTRRNFVPIEEDVPDAKEMNAVQEAQYWIAQGIQDIQAETFILENYVAKSFQTASNEARKSFKDPTVYIEALAPQDAKHIEIQVESDLYGNYRHLLERDCSGLIRGQKLAEEGPAIFVPNDQRRAMRAAGLRVARAAGYQNVGTCEFLYSPSMNQFWFMEMNTRLQVEHPVTELLTGLHLIEIQMKRAMGIPMTDQEKSAFDDIFDVGKHVVAARINARNPNKGFAPSPGEITRLRVPEEPDVRLYFSLREKSTVSTSSDSQIGHVFAVGVSRTDALGTLRRALKKLAVKGIDTTIEFSIDTLEADGKGSYREGGHTIYSFDKMAEKYGDRDLPVSGPVALTAAAIHRMTSDLRKNRLQFLSDLEGGRPLSPDLLLPTLSFDLPFAGKGYSVSARRITRDLYAISIGDATFQAQIFDGDNPYVFSLEGKPYTANVSTEGQLRVQIDGRNFEGVINDPTKVRSHLQGSVWKVEVKPGDRVKVGSPLIIVESMKMENMITAESAGVVREIKVQEGEDVRPNQVLIDFEPEGESLPTQKAQIIPLSNDVNSIFHYPERLAQYVEKYPFEKLQEVLVRLMKGAAYREVEEIKDKKKEMRGAGDVILAYYQAQVIELKERLKKVSSLQLTHFIQTGEVASEADLETASTLKDVEAMLRRLMELIDLFVRDEQAFAQLANERKVYLEAKEGAFDLAISHSQMATKARLLKKIFGLVRELPYQAEISSSPSSNNNKKRSLVAALGVFENFRADAYREIRSHARDLIQYANPQPTEDSQGTEDKILEAASLPLFSPRRNSLTDQLIGAHVLSASRLLALLDHPDFEVRSLAGYVLLKRSYARHEVIDDTYELHRYDALGKEYSSWHFLDGQTGDLRLGVAFGVAPQRGSLREVLNRAGEVLSYERTKLPKDRSGKEDSVEILISPKGIDDYADHESFLKDLRERLSQAFTIEQPSRVSITIRRGDGRQLEHHHFRPNEEGQYEEDMRFRGLDSHVANQLEMGRWVKFDLDKKESRDPYIHMWKATGKAAGKKNGEKDERFTVRTLVRHAEVRTTDEGLSLPQLRDSYQRTAAILQAELDRYDRKKRPHLNHLFYNIQPVVRADYEKTRELITSVFDSNRGNENNNGEDLVDSPLLKIEVLAKVRDQSAPRGHREVLFIINRSGPVTYHKGFVVIPKKGKRYGVDYDRFLEVQGQVDHLRDEDFKLLGQPYTPKTELEKRRAERQANGNVYVYDRPKVVQDQLAKIWQNEGRTPPSNFFETKELVLEAGVLKEMDRDPMQNDRSMVAWRAKILYPGESEPRTVILLSSDYTHENGTISPKEGDFYTSVLQYATREGVPFIQILEGNGARMGLDPNFTPSIENGKEIPSPVLLDATTGDIYLTEEDYHSPPKYLDPGVKAEKLGDLVSGEWVDLSLGEGQGTQKVFHIRTIFGGVQGLNTENLAQGSGQMAGELERAYDLIPTITIIVDTVVGILTYLARTGRRVIQVVTKPQLLTGNRALNKLYKKVIFPTNREIGDGSVMLPNGVSQFGVQDEPEGIRTALDLLRYLPRKRGEASPVVPGVSLDDRDVASLLLGDGQKPGIILDQQGKVQAYDPRHLIDALFDQNSFQEAAKEWGKVIVAGRVRIGGVPVGVIAFDPRTQTLIIPADPADPSHRERRVPQAGSVWHPDASFKTAQMLMDFEREGLPKVLLANVKGFPGGSHDMGPGSITKFGHWILHSVVKPGQERKLLLPLIVVIPPFGELRGGADVVIDSYVNRQSIVMIIDEHGEISVLPAEGMYAVPVIGDLFKADKRYEGAQKQQYWDSIIKAHQTPERALRVGSVQQISPTRNLRRNMYEAVVRKQNEVRAHEQILAAQSQLKTIAEFHGIPVTEAADGSLVVGARDVFLSEETRVRFETLLKLAKARRG